MDGDSIHFGVGGIEPMVLDSTHLHLYYGQHNVFVGKDAGEKNNNTSSSILGGYNTGIGSEVLKNNTDGYSNTGLGALLYLPTQLAIEILLLA